MRFLDKNDLETIFIVIFHPPPTDRHLHSLRQLMTTMPAEKCSAGQVRAEEGGKATLEKGLFG